MPFGLTNAPSCFQRFMDVVVAGLKWKTLLVYLDDICVFSKNFDSHLADLREVFQRIRQAGMKLKPKKCHLFQTQIKYLGHVVTAEGVRPDPDKLKAIALMPTHNTVTLVKSFLGLVGYYRKFIPDFASLCGPLYELTRMDVEFGWGIRQEKAFLTVKNLLTSESVLVHPDFSLPFRIHTDAYC